MKVKINNIVNNKFKGNISILIIFVLLISGLIGILTMNFIKDMLGYTGDIYSYNKAYYYANAGLELSLTEIDNAGIGFSNNVESVDSIFVNNFSCLNCSLDLKIKGRTQYLSDKFWLGSGCKDNNAFVLQSGGSIVIPLFTQKNIATNAELFSKGIEYNKEIIKHTNKFKFVSNDSSNKRFNVGLFILSGTDIQKDLLYISSYNGTIDMINNYFRDFEEYYNLNLSDFYNQEYFMYLVISNIKNDKVSFCVNMNDVLNTMPKIIELPAANFFVDSFSKYNDKSVGLQAIYKQPIPNFLINTYNSN